MLFSIFSRFNLSVIYTVCLSLNFSTILHYSFLCDLCIAFTIYLGPKLYNFCFCLYFCVQYYLFCNSFHLAASRLNELILTVKYRYLILQIIHSGIKKFFYIKLVNFVTFYIFGYLFITTNNFLLNIFKFGHTCTFPPYSLPPLL